MGKRYLVIAMLILLFICPMPVKAEPPWDGGMIIWPPFWQMKPTAPGLGWVQSPWAEKPYAGNPDKKFKDHGCLVTSFAMLLNFHGLKWIPDNFHEPNLLDSTDPGSLNKWLTEWGLYTQYTDASGYTSDLLHPLTIKEVYYHSTPWLNWNKSVSPVHNCQPVSNRENCFDVPWSTNADALLENDLFWGMPDVMNIQHTSPSGTPSSHFVLIGGYDQKVKSYRAYDPGRSYVTVPPPGLTWLYHDAYGNRTWDPLRILRYSATYTNRPPNLSRLTSWVYSPVEIQIIDPKGQITGYDPGSGSKKEDISRAYYSEEARSLDPNDLPAEPVKTLSIDEPSSGNYILKIFGTGDGPYTIKIQGTREDGTINLDTSLTGTAYAGLQQTYRLTYSPTGDASLSNTNQPPVANAGSNQTGEQSYEIQFDGSATSDPDGDPLKYAWSFVSRPDGSSAALSDASAISPTFIPDLPGTYVLQAKVPFVLLTLNIFS